MVNLVQEIQVCLFKSMPSKNEKMGKNWNSNHSKWTNIVSDEANELAKEAKRLKNSGLSVKDSANRLGRSKSRVYEYLRD